MLDVVQFVKKLCEDRGLRPEELATILKVSQQSIWNWCNDRAKPSPLAEEAIRKLAADLKGGRGK